MSVELKLSDAVNSVSEDEWRARVDLAAVYHLLTHFGWDDVIYNHSSMRVPGEPQKFLMKRHDLLYNEVTASNLVKVDMLADLDEKSGVNRPGFVLHGAVLNARPDVHCAIHIHTRTGMAISGLKGGLRMYSQAAMRFYNRIGYHPYEGITESFDERERICADLGQNRALIMHHHGLLTVGQTAREAFVLMKYLMDASEIQLKMQATGQVLLEIQPEICEKVARQYKHHDSGRGAHDWPAYLRLLEQTSSTFKN